MLNVPNNIKNDESDIEGNESDTDLINNENEENINNYKGAYYNDDTDEKYYEGGAHFQYLDLCRRLEILYFKFSQDRRGSTLYLEKESFSDFNKYNNDSYMSRLDDKSFKINAKDAVEPPSDLNKIRRNYEGNFNNILDSIETDKEPTKIHSDGELKSIKSINTNGSTLLNSNLNLISKNVLKDLKSLRDKTNSIKNLNIGMFGNTTADLNNLGLCLVSSKNVVKKDNSIIAKDQNMENLNNTNSIYIKLKPSNVTKPNNPKNDISKKKYMMMKTAEKKVNNTKIQKSASNINSGLVKSNKILLNTSAIKNKIKNNISKAASIMNDLSQITTFGKSRNISKTKQSEKIINNYGSLIITNKKIMPNKLIYSDSKLNCNIHLSNKDKENIQNITNSGIIDITLNEGHQNKNLNNNNINNNKNNSPILNDNQNINSSNLLNSFNLKIINNNKSRNTQRNLPDKGNISKNHTTSDNNKTACINTHDSIPSKFLCSTMKNEQNLAGLNSFNNIPSNTYKNLNNLSKDKPNQQSINIDLKKGNTDDRVNILTPTKPKILFEKTNKSLTQNPNNNVVKVLPQFLIKNTSTKTPVVSTNINYNNKKVALNCNLIFNSLDKGYNKIINNKKEVKTNSRALKLFFLNNQSNKKDVSLCKEAILNKFNINKESSNSKEKIITSTLSNLNSQYNKMNEEDSLSHYNYQQNKNSNTFINLSSKTIVTNTNNTNTNTNTNMYNSASKILF